MIKKFDEFNRTMNESFDWDEFNFPKVEDLLSRGYETSSETYTPIWIGVPISKSEYENEWEETDWQYDHNISFSDHVNILSPCPTMEDAVAQIVEAEKDKIQWYTLERTDSDNRYMFLCFDTEDDGEPYSNYIIIIR
jgi:hypothetical protein